MKKMELSVGELKTELGRRGGRGRELLKKEEETREEIAFPSLADRRELLFGDPSAGVEGGNWLNGREARTGYTKEMKVFGWA